MKFLVAIHHPDNFDPSTEDAALHQAIDELNDEMVAADCRIFVGGLRRAHTAKSLKNEGGEIQVSEGPYLATDEHVAGFWVLETDSEEEALEWGRKAVLACRAPVEVRQFN